MFNTRFSVSINRSREDVFDYVTDPANDAQWQRSCKGSQWASEGPHGVGSIKTSVDKFLGRKIESTIEFTIWDRPNTFGLKVIEGPIPFQAVIGLESAGESGTELTVDVEAEFRGFFKLVGGLVGKQLEKELNTDFNTLKLLMEGKQG